MRSGAKNLDQGALSFASASTHDYNEDLESSEIKSAVLRLKTEVMSFFLINTSKGI